MNVRKLIGWLWAKNSHAFRMALCHLPLCIAVVSLLHTAHVIAATLNVKFDVRTRALEGDPMHPCKKIAIFVLDRSESMTWAPKRGEKLANGKKVLNRNQILVESFRDRIRAINATDPDTLVYIVPFSDKKGEIGQDSGPYDVKTDADVEKLVNWHGLAYSECKGRTYLYDTLASVVKFIDGIWAGDPFTRVSLYIYTDGENETREDAEYPSVKRSYWGYVDEVAYRQQLGKAKTAFDQSLYGREFSSYVNEGRLETYWRWLGDRQLLANFLSKTKDEYKISFSAESTAMKNPNAVSEQELDVTMHVPLPERYFKELAGVQCPIILQLAGRDVDSKMISLKPGKKSISFHFSDNISPGNFTGKLLLKDLPELDRAILRPPTPLELTFTVPGRLSFTAVDPKGEVFVKRGTKKVFSAKATENADIKWSWPGGTRTMRTGEPCEMSFVEAEPFDVRLKAQKQGFMDSPEEKIRVHVIDADVGVRVETQHPTAGKGVDFVAKPHGKPDSYSWQIDGQTLSERSDKLKGQMFGLGGKHRVKVTAYYGHGIIADSGDVSFDVEARPNIEIDSPESGNYDFGEKIECKANVEGDFDKVVWELEGPSSEKQEAVVDKTAKVSKPIFFVPAKGGRYTLKATANGSAGSLPAKASVMLKIAHEDLGVAIISPSSGALIPLGALEKGTNLVAEVKGENIVRVKWFVRKETGDEVEIRTTPVQNGRASCSFRPDPTTKDGESLYVRAEAVFKGDAPSEPVTSPSIELIASRYAEINVEAKVNGNEANGREVRFGDQVELHAHCNGDVDPGKVKWYKSVNGVIDPMESVRGSHCTSPKEVPNKKLPNGDNLRTVHYFAVAGLSDGSAVTSRTVIVHHYCPDVKFAIKLPPGEDGLPRRSFRPGDMIHLHLPDGDSFTDVEWNFGDGTKATRDNVEHSYLDEKSHKIMAKGRCAKCGKPFSAVVDVSTKCPDLELAVVLKGEERFAKKYGLGKPVNVALSVKNGDATEVSWDFGDGGTSKGMETSHSYEKCDTYTITASAKCKRCGKHFTASSEKIEVAVIPPQAVLEIVQKGSHYGTGDRITLSAKQSKGDIVDCVWEVDGKELVDYRGKKEADVKLPDRPCEIVAKVKLIGPEGTEPSEAQHEIRVRNGWIGIGIFSLLALVVVVLAKLLLFDNGPARWVVRMYCCEWIDHSTQEGVDLEISKYRTQSGRDTSRVKRFLLAEYWSFVDKMAVIPLKKVMKDPKTPRAFKASVVGFTSDDDKIYVYPKGKELIVYKGALEWDRDDGLRGHMIENYHFRWYRKIKDTQQPRRFRFLLDDSVDDHRYEVYFVILTFCAICVALWAALKFAI